MHVRGRMIRRGLNQFAGLTVGVVGFGIIGQATARQCSETGANVIFSDPAIESGDRVELRELLARADLVTLHVPLQDGTRGLIGAAEIGLMKPGAILVNAARGGIVDEAALVEALEAGRIGGAVVDVYSTEPPASDNPLLTVSAAAVQRLILTLHIADVTRQAWAGLFAEAWDNAARAPRDERGQDMMHWRSRSFVQGRLCKRMQESWWRRLARTTRPSGHRRDALPPNSWIEDTHCL